MKMRNYRKHGVVLALSVLAATASLPAFATGKLDLELVYDSSTLHISPAAFPGGGSFAGGTIQVLARIYLGHPFKNCSAGGGCGFVNGQPANGSIGVMTCGGVVLSAALDPILQNFGKPGFPAAVATVLQQFTDTPFVRTTHTYEFGATIDSNGLIRHAPNSKSGENLLMSDGYISVYPDGDSRVTFRSIIGGQGTFNGFSLKGATGAGAYTVAGFFDNGSNFLTENVTFTLPTVEDMNGQ